MRATAAEIADLEARCDIVPAKRPAVATHTVLPYPLVVIAWGVETKSEANMRQHWSVRLRRFKAQRDAMATYAKQLITEFERIGHEIANHGLRITVTLTRMGKRYLDSDNLAGSFKAVQDEVAVWFGVDDGNRQIEWKYEQAQGCGVVVKVERQ